MVPMVAQDEEMVVFKLWSCSSTLTSLERGLEGTLADLRWKAMASMEAEVLCFPLEMEEKRAQRKLLKCCRPAMVVLYIYNEKAEEVASLTL
jgi:hypothetical protein